jgi:hypothetical protein
MAPVRPTRHEQVNKFSVGVCLVQGHGCECGARAKPPSRGIGGGLKSSPKRTQKSVLALGRLISFGFRKKAPSGRFMRRPLNLNSHNHNQRDRRPRFSLAVLIEHLSSTPRYDISLRQNRASNIRGPAVPPRVDRWADASVSHCRTVVRPLQRMRLERDADDNRTALITPSNARFTDLGMLVLSDFHPTTELCQTLPHFAFVPEGDISGLRGIGSYGKPCQRGGLHISPIRLSRRSKSRNSGRQQD